MNVVNYEVPKMYEYMIESIQRVGRGTYKVNLKDGFEYDGSNSYYVQAYALFRSFDYVRGASARSVT